jgi:hypothetical protein
VVYLVDNCPTAAANAYAIAGFADGVGTGIFDMNAGHVNALHHAGLFVDAYTLSTDALLGRGSYETVLGYGVDGIITNNPNLGVAAVAALDPVHRTGQALFCAGLIGLIGLVSWAWRRRAAGVSILWQRTDFAA